MQISSCPALELSPWVPASREPSITSDSDLQAYGQGVAPVDDASIGHAIRHSRVAWGFCEVDEAERVVEYHQKIFETLDGKIRICQRAFIAGRQGRQSDKINPKAIESQSTSGSA